MTPKLLIIGGVAAGTRGAARAKRVNPEAAVTLLTREPHISYSACSFPYYIGRRVDRVENLILHSPAEFEKSRGVKVFARHEAIAIDRATRTVTARDLDTGRESRFEYDALLLATGASPRLLKVKGSQYQRIFTLRSPGDARAIRETAESSDVRRMTVVGGGLIGIEVADNLLSHPLDEVNLIHNHPSLLSNMLDADMAVLIERELSEAGVRLLLDDEITRIESCDGRSAGTLFTRRDRLDTDAVIVAIGVEPNIELARAAKLEIGAAGGIRVNAWMQTSDPLIYAAGDCAECFNVVSRRWGRAPLGSVANRQGRVAGGNMAGAADEFPGIAGASLTHAGRLTAGRTGMTERQAREAGLDVVSVIINASPRAGWAGDGASERLWLKAIAEPATRRMLGVQVIGVEGADKRLDCATQLLHAGATVGDFADFEVAYHPLSSQPVDPLNTVGQVLDHLIESGVSPLSADVLAGHLESDPGGIVLLDVREQRDKARTGSLPDAQHIPMSELRRRAGDELPRGKTIVTFDSNGRLATKAAFALRDMGFDQAAPLNGGLTFWRGSLV